MNEGYVINEKEKYVLRVSAQDYLLDKPNRIAKDSNSVCECNSSCGSCGSAGSCSGCSSSCSSCGS